jgi:hypothetical protein
MAEPVDRHEPLPPLNRLPRYLWVRMGPVARALVVALAVAALAATAVLAPKIADTKRRNAAQERRERAENRAREKRAIEALQRPRSDRSHNVDPGTGSMPARLRARSGLVADLEADLTRDSNGRRGNTRAKRTTCRGNNERGSGPPPERDLTVDGGRYACTAVTSVVLGSNGARGAIGYPYRAKVSFVTGSMVWCRISGKAGEGSNVARPLATIPVRCGG